MGIFAGSEKGEILEAANCDNSDREREGVTLQPEAGNKLIYCQLWLLHHACFNDLTNIGNA